MHNVTNPPTTRTYFRPNQDIDRPRNGCTRALFGMYKVEPCVMGASTALGFLALFCFSAAAVLYALGNSLRNNPTAKSALQEGGGVAGAIAGSMVSVCTGATLAFAYNRYKKAVASGEIREYSNGLLEEELCNQPGYRTDLPS